MCANVKKYENIIFLLDNDIYPVFQQLLNSSNANLFPHKINYSFREVQKDFESLEIVDRMLIFPTILSLFTEGRRDNEFVPDIKAIINITNIKEEKLKKSVDQISAIFESKEILIEDKNT